MELEIREARNEDFTDIHKIELASYSDPWPRSLMHLIFGRSPHLFLVATIRNRVIGYIISEIEQRNNERIGHIMNLAVDEEWRKKGVASRLMVEIEKRLFESGAVKSYLEVRTSNTAAQNLYRKHGYLVTGLLPNYYRSEDGIAMEKPL
jgi:ribosomal-protein-alanine N-acetyltransferase